MSGSSDAGHGKDSALDGEARRVLVAEDSSATQDILELVLSQRGLEVDMVDDGKAALSALRAKPYDVALLDFNMPEMNGLEVVSAYLSGDLADTCPHFVAITGDVEGMLSSPDNSEQFDRVLPKPLDINTIVEVIEELGAARPAPQATGAAQRTVAAEQPRRRHSPIEDLDYRFLHWPDDADRRRLAFGVGPGGYDAVLVHAVAGPRDLAPLWEARGLHLLPVIDLTGRLGTAADLDGSTLAASEIGPVQEVIEAFADRRAAMHADLVRAQTPEDRLLGRIHVSGVALTPRLDGNEVGLVGYNGVPEPGPLCQTAQKLVESDLLSATFFDRLHHCPACDSARFNVREECPDCGSAQVDDVSYLHHFRCAYQGPESDFRRGDDLICPKCRRELRHFGRDYDRPGMMVLCADCGHGTSEPAIGFLCVDCGARTEGDAIETRDVFSYRLTDQALGYLEAGASFLGFAQRSLRFADLPLDLVVALNAEAKRFNDESVPFTLLSIAYEKEREITREHGARQFGQLRSLFVETLQQELGDEASVARGQSYDFALLKGVAPDAISDRVEALQRDAAAQLRLDPGAVLSVFGPEEIG